jgi:hypothetical protein
VCFAYLQESGWVSYSCLCVCLWVDGGWGMGCYRLGWNSYQREREREVKTQPIRVNKAGSTCSNEMPFHALPIIPLSNNLTSPAHCYRLASTLLAWQPSRSRQPNHAFCCGLPLWAPFPHPVSSPEL